MTMLIRQMNQQDAEENLELSQYAFQYEMEEEDRQKVISGFKPEINWGCFVDNRLAAQLTLHPMSIWLNGRHFAMGGIAGIATWPEYRRLGMVGKLISRSLFEMKNQRQSLSYLHPFNFAFYRKYGWEIFHEYKSYEINKDMLPRLTQNEGNISRSADWEQLNWIYNTFAIRYNGMLIRDEMRWRGLVNKADRGHAACYYDDNGNPLGYVIYKVEHKVMTIHELIYLDDAARLGLWEFIVNHDSMMDKLLLKAPVDDPLSFLLDNPMIKQQVSPFGMARIVDVLFFMENYLFKPCKAASEFILQVEDRHAPWNEGSFSVQVDTTGNARIIPLVRISDTLGEGEIVVSCTIQTLTAMMMGYKRPAFFHSIGRLTGASDIIALLENIIPDKLTYLADYF